MSGFWAGNIQIAGAGHLGLLRHLLLSCAVSPAWQLQGSLASFIGSGLERSMSTGKSYCLLWPSLGSHKMSLPSHCICWKGSASQPIVKEKVTRVYILMGGGLRNFLPCCKSLQLGQNGRGCVGSEKQWWGDGWVSWSALVVHAAIVLHFGLWES